MRFYNSPMVHVSKNGLTYDRLPSFLTSRTTIRVTSHRNPRQRQSLIQPCKCKDEKPWQLKTECKAQSFRRQKNVLPLIQIEGKVRDDPCIPTMRKVRPCRQACTLRQERGAGVGAAGPLCRSGHVTMGVFTDASGTCELRR